MSTGTAKGTPWESKIVDYLRGRGVPYAERRARSGARDRGDIAGIPGLVIEAKNSPLRIDHLGSWVNEAEVERINDGAALAVVWHKRRGKSSAGDGYVTMSGATLVKLLAEAGYMPTEGNSNRGDDQDV